MLREGLYCVSKYYQEYHRAVIVKINRDNKTVKVNYTLVLLYLNPIVSFYRYFMWIMVPYLTPVPIVYCFLISNLQVFPARQSEHDLPAFGQQLHILHGQQVHRLDF